MFIGAFLNELFLQQFDAVALHLSFPVRLRNLCYRRHALTSSNTVRSMQHTTWLIGVPTSLPSCGMYRVADHPWFRMYARKFWMQLASKGRSKTFDAVFSAFAYESLLYLGSVTNLRGCFAK